MVAAGEGGFDVAWKGTSTRQWLLGCEVGEELGARADSSFQRLQGYCKGQNSLKQWTVDATESGDRETGWMGVITCLQDNEALSSAVHDPTFILDCS